MLNVNSTIEDSQGKNRSRHRQHRSGQHRSRKRRHGSREGKFGDGTNTVPPCSYAEDTTTRAESRTGASWCSSYMDSGVSDIPASAVTSPHLSTTRSCQQTTSTAISNESINVYFGLGDNHKTTVEASRANSSGSSPRSVSTPTPQFLSHQPNPSSGLRFGTTQPVRPSSPTSSATTIETSNPWSEQPSPLSTMESEGHETEAKPPALPERPSPLSTLIGKFESEDITFQLDSTMLQKARKMLDNCGPEKTSISGKRYLPMIGSVFLH